MPPFVYAHELEPQVNIYVAKCHAAMFEFTWLLRTDSRADDWGAECLIVRTSLFWQKPFWKEQENAQSF